MSRKKLTDLTSATALVDVQAEPLRFSIRRPDDLLVAELTLYNFRITSGATPTLTRVDAGSSAILVVELPPQSFGEQVFLDPTGPSDMGDAMDGTPTAGETIPSLGGTRIRMCRASRLAFTMPSNVTSIPFTIAGILAACRSWPSRRSQSALAEPGAQSQVAMASEIERVNGLVASTEFRDTRTELMRELRKVASDRIETVVNAVSTRIAAQAKALFQRAASPASAGRDRVTTLVENLVVAEVDAMVAQFPALRDAKVRALTTMSVTYGTLAELQKLKFETVPGFVATPSMPLLAELVSPARPSSRVTAIEMPYRLVMSPIGAARWTHALNAIARQGRHELWHTRMTVSNSDTGVDAPGKLRAIWSEDYLLTDFAPTIASPFRMSLDAQDRQMLVRLTAGFGEETITITSTPATYTPLPTRAKRVILTALGGSLDTEGSWVTRPSGVDLESWRHLAGLGRDQYVRVVYAGYLLPFGHRASLVKVTERKFEGTESANRLGKRVAILRQRFFLVVQDPIRTFDGTAHINGGHPFPFTEVELLTRVTPNLVAPDNAACAANETGRTLYQGSGVAGGVTPRQLFWPMMSTTPGTGNFRFDISAIDRAGARSTFSLPLLFMSEVANNGTVTKGGVTRDRIRNVIDAYNAEGPARRKANMQGASVCFAPPDSAGDGDPRLPTQSLLFSAGRVAMASTIRINSYPEVAEANVAMRAVQRILGRDDAQVNVRYSTIYAAQGFGDGNRGEVFLEFIPSQPQWPMSFGPSANASRSDAVGAVATPAMNIGGFSRRIGLASNLAEITANRFNPVQFFGDAKILGGIKLTDVVPPPEGLTVADAPKFVSKELAASGNLPARTEARYDWRTRVARSDPLKLLIPNADVNAESPFRMQSVTTTPIDSPSGATSTTTATIGNVKVNLFGFIVLWFRELRFTSERGQKPGVVVDMHPTRGVEFGGPLRFVNALRPLIPGNGFSDPSAISVSPSGISAGYALTIPSVQVGIFALSGVSIGARFSLPFDARPVEVGFNFGERHNPFSLTVSLLGGGGFLTIGVGADGVREVEAAIEAQARLSIDLGVASGAVEIAVGIYFHWLTDADGTGGLIELAGYVRVHGELDIMGIISMSLTFNLQLAFTKDGARCVVWGEATVTVEIEVLVFSGEVTVRCRKEFVGSDADPTFIQLMPGDSTWSSYCLAFAGE